MSVRFPNGSELSEENPWFPTPFVFREGSKVSLHFDIIGTQSLMDDEQPELLSLNYTRLMMAVLFFVPNPKHLGCIGLGGGSIPKYCHKYLDQTQISVAEINPKVIALRDEFHIPRDSDRFGVFQRDGAEFVGSHPNTFDVLMVDAFDFHGQPPHLCSTAFYEACRKALTPTGHLVVNLCHESKEKAVTRIEHVFGQRTFRLKDQDGSNLVVIVGKEAIGDFFPSFPFRARALEMAHPLDFQAMVHCLWHGQLPILLPLGNA